MAMPIGEKLIGNNGHDKKMFGVYYSPSGATRILCQWAIRTPDDHILEPSFGACGFLEASRDRLMELNAQHTSEQLFGCDIDNHAFSDYLLPKFQITDLSNQFIQEDFLKTSPESFKVPAFDVVIGNPPYISSHNMSADQKKSVAEAMQQMNIFLGNKASLWAYFVLHSLNFLKPGGRIAWLLPGSFLHADYATKIKDFIGKRFQRSLVIQLGQRLFLSEGTDESTVILLAEGWDQEGDNQSLELDYAPNLEKLQDVISTWQAGTRNCNSFSDKVSLSLLSQSTAEYFSLISKRLHVTTLGDIAEILIGIVTGANKFFIINKVTARDRELSNHHLRYIFSKLSITKGLSLRASDLKSAAARNFPCLLIDTSKMQEEDIALNNYLAGFSEANKVNNKTFKKK